MIALQKLGIQCIPQSYFVVYSSAVFLVEGLFTSVVLAWHSCTQKMVGSSGTRRPWHGSRSARSTWAHSSALRLLLYYYCNSYCRLPETSTGEGGTLHQFLNTGIKCNTSGVAYPCFATDNNYYKITTLNQNNIILFCIIYLVSLY